MTAPLPWKGAWIVGGSTGIGKDLALLLAAGGVKTAISARSEKPLAEAAALHANLKAVVADAASQDILKRAYDTIVDAQGSPDLVVLNAAIWDPMNVEDYGAARAITSMNVNYGGVCNALEVILPAMKQRRSGHIAIVASVAGYRGLSRALAYAPTKAALINLSEALNLELGPYNVKVSVINPGFVATPLTAQNDFEMPFLMQPDEAARRTIAGLAAGRFEIAYPRRFVAILRTLRALPYPVFFRLITRVVLKDK
jgi:short-subunit dehydrogenase